MATLKEIRRRIRSVQSTQQITKAMQMVAAAKLRRAQARSLSARPYTTMMNAILEQLSVAAAERTDPLFEVREVRRRTLVVVASDKGLCGSYNANVFRAAEARLAGAERGEIDMIPVARRTCDYFGRRRWTGSYRIPELGDQVDLAKVHALARHLIEIYRRGETDRVEFVYTRFISTGSRRVAHEIFLPIATEPREGEGPVAGQGGGMLRDYIFEPSAAEIFGDLLPRYVQTRVMSAFADSLASEHSARLIGMSAATKNAGEMIASLTLIRNRLRQAAITKEISELVGGAEALR